MAQVFIPSQLTSYTDGVSRLAAQGGSIEQVLDDLDRRYPGLKFRVVDEQDRIRRHMRIFKNGDRAQDIRQPVTEADEVLIFGALSGG
jgi:molybdopterin converting factor small subunit